MSNFKDVDTYLEHFGKPGMKWGKSSASSSSSGGSSGGSKEVKLKGKAKTQAIRQARANTHARMREVNILGDKSMGARTDKEAKYFRDKANTKVSELFKSKDYATAQKSTRGEKVYNALALTALSTALVGIAANAISK